MKHFLSLKSKKNYHVIILILFFASCEKENAGFDHVETNNKITAKEWVSGRDFELSDNLFFGGKIDWENSFEASENLYLPLSENEEAISKKTINLSGKGKEIGSVFTQPFMKLKKNEDGGYDESLVVFYSKNQENLNIDFRHHGLGYFSFNSSNQVEEFIQNENVHENIVESVNGQGGSSLANSGDCSTYYVVQTTNYSDGSSENEILATYEVCLGSGGGGGGSGGGGGGGGGGGSVFDDIFSQTNHNFLCGGYNWSTIGTSNVVNISGLGVLMSGPFGQQINIEWSNLCVTIPNYQTDAYQASSKFNSAWNQSLVQFVDYLNLVGDLASLDPVDTSAMIKTLLISNLNSKVPGSSIVPGPCGGASTSNADYCS